MNLNDVTVIIPALNTDLGPFRAIDYAKLRELAMCDTNYGWTIENADQSRASRVALARNPGAVPLPSRRQQNQWHGVGRLQSGQQDSVDHRAIRAEKDDAMITSLRRLLLGLASWQCATRTTTGPLKCKSKRCVPNCAGSYVLLLSVSSTGQRPARADLRHLARAVCNTR